MTKSSNPPHHECPNLMETTMTGGYSWRIYFNRSMKSKNQKRMSRSMQQAEDMGWSKAQRPESKELSISKNPSSRLLHKAITQKDPTKQIWESSTKEEASTFETLERWS